MKQYSTINNGTALTPRMQAAVERRTAGLPNLEQRSPFMDEIEQLRAMLENAQQTIRERDAKIEAITTVSENAKALLKAALEREYQLRYALSSLLNCVDVVHEPDQLLRCKDQARAALLATGRQE